MCAMRLMYALRTFLALDANSREHFVSDTFSAAGDTLTTSTHLLLEPSESSNKRVNCKYVTTPAAPHALSLARCMQAAEGTLACTKGHV